MIKVLLLDFNWVLAGDTSNLEPSDRQESWHQVSLLNHGLRYWNRSLCEIVDSGRYQSYVLSSGSQRFLQSLQNKLVPPFSDILSTKQLGKPKFKIATFKWFCKEYQLTPSQVLFLDDQAQNIAAASATGLQTHQFTTNQSLFNTFTL